MYDVYLNQWLQKLLMIYELSSYAIYILLIPIQIRTSYKINLCILIFKNRLSSSFYGYVILLGFALL